MDKESRQLPYSEWVVKRLELIGIGSDFALFKDQDHNHIFLKVGDKINTVPDQ